MTRRSRRIDRVLKNLGKRIRRFRERKGWSQEHLAEEARMHRTYMWGIERGVRNPSLRQMVLIADALGISLMKLFRQI